MDFEDRLQGENNVTKRIAVNRSSVAVSRRGACLATQSVVGLRSERHSGRGVGRRARTRADESDIDVADAFRRATRRKARFSAASSDPAPNAPVYSLFISRVNPWRAQWFDASSPIFFCCYLSRLNAIVGHLERFGLRHRKR